VPEGGRAWQCFDVGVRGGRSMNGLLGTGAFVERMLRSMPAPATRSRAQAAASFLEVLAACAAEWG